MTSKQIPPRPYFFLSIRLPNSRGHSERDQEGITTRRDLRVWYLRPESRRPRSSEAGLQCFVRLSCGADEERPEAVFRGTNRRWQNPHAP